MTLLFTSFIAGLLTVLAPCVLPLLPVIVGGSVGADSRKRALTIAVSLAVTVVAFTLLLKASTVLIDIPAGVWNTVSGVILLFLGLTMVFPALWYRIPFVGKLSSASNKTLGIGAMKNSFWGDVLVGAALGPVFSSCSPTYFIILATVLPVSFSLGLVYLSVYAVGLALSLFALSLIGQSILNRLANRVSDGSRFKKIVGVIIIIVALAVMTGLDKQIQTYLVSKGIGVTKLETDLIQKSESDINSQADRGVSTDSPIDTSTTKVTDVVVPAPVQLNSNRKILGKWKEIVRPGGFVNTNGKSIKIADYIGKDIILLDIMTYSCINCQRTFPYLKKWDETYRSKGLTIIGIHTPEFAFERKSENVDAAMKKFGLTFPIVLDNDYGTWNAYKNNFWPHKYIIDLNGNIVFDHTGEGMYDETESIIRELLIERNTILKTGIELDKASKAGTTSARSGSTQTSNPNWSSIVVTPETYLGSDRSQYAYTGTDNIPLSQYRVNGAWKQGDESITSTLATDTFESHFISPNFYIVANAEKPVTAKILLDGKPITTSDAGLDVKNGIVTFSGSQLYNLYKNLNDTRDHTIKIIPMSAGLELFALTFGE